MDHSRANSVVQNKVEQGEYLIGDGRQTTGREVHGTMKDNAMRTATETQEDVNGGAVEMRDNGDDRQG